MTFVAPLWLAAAGLVGAGVLIAHLFSSTVPPQDVLPTVRFIPESTPLTVMRSRRVSDWLLLVLRLLVVVLLGFALSGAHLPRRAPPSIVLIDASRAVASMSPSIDSALAASYNGGEFVVFDSVARQVKRDDVRQVQATNARGSLSAALAAAHRLVGSSAGANQVQLVIVSPTAREEVDSAVQPLVDLWQGPLRVIHVPVSSQPASVSWEIRTTGDDPVVAALAGMPNQRSNATVRVVRTPASRADSQWAESTGGMLVVWPVGGESLTKRAVADAQGGLAAGGNVVVAPFVRAAQPKPGKAIVRWMDGEPAATEGALGRGCVREVAIPVDAVGDVALRASFRGVVQSLLTPCGGARDFTASSRMLSRVATDVIQSGGGAKNHAEAGSLPIWLALVAAVLLIAEQALRGRGRRVA